MEEVSAEINFFLLVIAGTMGMLSLVLLVYIYKKKVLTEKARLQELKNAYQKEMLQASIEAQEQERRRIAEDLHDDVGAMLSLVRLNASRASEKARDRTLKDSTEEIKALIDEIILNVKRISRDLLPSTLNEFGLIEAIKELSDKINNTSPHLIKFNYLKFEEPIDKEIELALFRIAQELINNAIKHASATEILIDLEIADDIVKLTVEDNGQGFSINKVDGGKNAAKGLGLKNIRSRVSMLDGTLEYKSSLSKGTFAQVKISKEQSSEKKVLA
ncbi:sensor histidine kinase [Fulvivirgaceae bacterium BMA10]|uniref:histidine kinase n=1 Tax=Splendidivirga corallicola TaxID=3051826 RepID=A0ABT8KQ87_9BACT|nr:sensor histidine kinase [Fulvivirgaceae bacterium BMA10]